MINNHIQKVKYVKMNLPYVFMSHKEFFKSKQLNETTEVSVCCQVAWMLYIISKCISKNIEFNKWIQYFILCTVVYTI